MKVTSVSKGPRRYGFTLVELVVVVLIMGIIAAVALPKMATSTNTAKTNSVKQSLAVVRDAIELFRADTGAYPTTATALPADLKPYLKGPFPAAPMGANAGSAAVVAGTTTPSVVTGGAGWAYVETAGANQGDFYFNETSGLAW